ncbi:MAG: enoyl-CoA hydratase/isomerase family protein [Maricaulaceae bacterium]|jgi:enoyl-CoA hydratase/carnithine racemase
MSGAGQVRYQLVDGVAEVSLCKPPFNGLDFEFLGELLIALERARDDEAARAVIVRSELETVFCAGLDLSQIVSKPIDDVRATVKRLYTDLWDVQCEMGKPTLASIGGAARGGGMTLAISCDVIVASQAASFGYPEIKLGLPPAIHFAHLPRLIGRAKAFELLFSGRAFSPDEALSMGLINTVTAAADLEARTRDLAASLAASAPSSIALARTAFVRATDAGYRRAVAQAVDDFCDIALTDDAQEGMSAFLEKRPPRWMR